MPRDGSGIYSQPYPDVVAGTTIESVKYNGNVNDVEQDLNTPRPIVAGGTGATNAHDAMVALSGEIAHQTVTNYDSHVFVSGSFKSAPGATAAPNPTDYFVGHVLDYNASSMLIAAYAPGGGTYSRVKSFTDGTWGAWVPSTTIADLDTRYVNVTGDSMTGDLDVTGDLTCTGNLVSTSNIFSANIPTTGYYHFGTSGTKFLWYDGANFNFAGGNVYAPTFFGDAFLTTGGAVYSTDSIELGSNTSAHPTFIDFHSSGLANDFDVRMQSDGGLGPAGWGTLTTTCGSFVVNNNGEGVVIGQFSGTNPYSVGLIKGDPGGGTMLHLQALHYPGVWLGLAFNLGGGTIFSFRNDHTAAKAGGSTTWVITSDARTKDVTGDYTAGLDAVAALNPVRYIYKGNNTYAPPAHFSDGTESNATAEQRSAVAGKEPAVPYPNSIQYGPAKDTIEYIGLVAQDVEITMPELIKREAGYIDGVAVDDMRSADYTPLIFALVNAVKELKARIEALEAG